MCLTASSSAGRCGRVSRRRTVCGPGSSSHHQRRGGLVFVAHRSVRRHNHMHNPILIVYLVCCRYLSRGNERIVHTCMLLYMTSWSVCYCMSRTLSNSTETSMCLIALCVLLHTYGGNDRDSTVEAVATTATSRRGSDSALLLAIAVSVAAVFIRPTAVVLLVGRQTLNY